VALDFECSGKGGDFFRAPPPPQKIVIPGEAEGPAFRCSYLTPIAPP
jgi:hypothetical protein